MTNGQPVGRQNRSSDRHRHGWAPSIAVQGVRRAAGAGARKGNSSCPELGARAGPAAHGVALYWKPWTGPWQTTGRTWYRHAHHRRRLRPPARPRTVAGRSVPDTSSRCNAGREIEPSRQAWRHRAADRRARSPGRPPAVPVPERRPCSGRTPATNLPRRCRHRDLQAMRRRRRHPAARRTGLAAAGPAARCLFSALSVRRLRAHSGRPSTPPWPRNQVPYGGSRRRSPLPSRRPAYRPGCRPRRHRPVQRRHRGPQPPRCRRPPVLWRPVSRRCRSRPCRQAISARPAPPTRRRRIRRPKVRPCRSAPAPPRRLSRRHRPRPWCIHLRLRGIFPSQPWCRPLRSPRPGASRPRSDRRHRRWMP